MKNSDITIGFLATKNFAIPNLGPGKSFHRDLFRIKRFCHFAHFPILPPFRTPPGNFYAPLSIEKKGLFLKLIYIATEKCPET